MNWSRVEKVATRFQDSLTHYWVEEVLNLSKPWKIIGTILEKLPQNFRISSAVIVVMFSVCCSLLYALEYPFLCAHLMSLHELKFFHLDVQHA